VAEAERAGPIGHPGTAFEDRRGTITDLIVDEPFESVSRITTVRGAVRGNHYHADTYQAMYISRGRIRLVTRMPGGPVRSFEAGPGDVVRTPPVEHHAVLALEDTDMLVFTRGPRSGENFESDTYRLSEPLIPESSG
jgi:quercetin dioxygenase-like cupin family protein